MAEPGGDAGGPPERTPETDAIVDGATGDERSGPIARYGFAIPTDEALACIGRHSPSGVVEIGAGCGYWAAALHERGVDVAAFDPEPAPSPRNPWFAGTEPWYPMGARDHSVVEQHPDRTLLIVWPTKDEAWPADALERYRAAGGDCVAYVGEGPGGRTGDDAFHAVLGEIVTCAQCAYGVSTVACICGVAPAWRRVETVELPHRPGQLDDLRVYRTLDAPTAAGPRRWRHRRGR